jgi:anti-sigma B factor antagonist
MKYTASVHGSVTVIALEGNMMGGPDATMLNGKLHDLVDAGKKQVVVNLAGVEFINSSGLSQLIGGASLMKNAGGALKLANSSEKISALLKITRLSPVFESYPSVTAAVASFSK